MSLVLAVASTFKTSLFLANFSKTKSITNSSSVFVDAEAVAVAEDEADTEVEAGVEDEDDYLYSNKNGIPENR